MLTWIQNNPDNPYWWITLDNNDHGFCFCLDIDSKTEKFVLYAYRPDTSYNHEVGEFVEIATAMEYAEDYNGHKEDEVVSIEVKYKSGKVLSANGEDARKIFEYWTNLEHMDIFVRGHVYNGPSLKEK